jgi:hypothetical protein
MHIVNTNRALVFGVLPFAALLAAACSVDDEPTRIVKSDAGKGGSGAVAGAGGSSSAGTAGSAGSTTSTTGSAGSTTAGSGGTAGAAGAGGSAGGASGEGGGGNGGAAGTDGGAPCNDPTLDSDMDGTPDCRDECPYDKDKILAGMCGCGFAENDSDGDGTVDCLPGHFYEAENGQLTDLGSEAGVTTVDGAAAPTGPFVIGNEAAASNGRYIAVSPGVTSESKPGSARAAYDISITKADTYVIWGRFYAPDTLHNCVWARVDGGSWTKWRGSTGEEWFWYHLHAEGDWANPIPFQLSVGHHALDVANCSDNTKLDRLYVTAGGDRPMGVSMCNPPHTILLGGMCVSSCGQLGGSSCDPVVCTGQVLLPAYDCTVCCAPSGDAGGADAGSAD